jgi:hypothetical protein
MADFISTINFQLQGTTVPVLGFFRVITHSIAWKIRDPVLFGLHEYLKKNDYIYDKINYLYQNHTGIKEFLIPVCYRAVLKGIS